MDKVSGASLFWVVGRKGQGECLPMCSEGRDGAHYPADPQRPGEAKAAWNGEATVERG